MIEAILAAGLLVWTCYGDGQCTYTRPEMVREITIAQDWRAAEKEAVAALREMRERDEDARR